MPMTPRTLGLTDPLHQYLMQVGVREPDELRLLREETLRMPGAQMLLAPEQAQFMGLLAQLTGVRRYLEIGTFTGCSALAIARVMPPDGRVVACEIDADFAAIAERHWRRAGVANKIEVRLAPALDTLDAMLAQGGQEGFDLCFIDADKENLAGYYERCLTLARGGGLILIDHTLWGGSVADAEDDAQSTRAVRAFNSLVHADQRVDMVLLPIGDGLTLARKRA
jgi:predicted O-methyltransferase YrrM